MLREKGRKKKKERKRVRERVREEETSPVDERRERCKGIALFAGTKENLCLLARKGREKDEKGREKERERDRERESVCV